MEQQYSMPRSASDLFKNIYESFVTAIKNKESTYEKKYIIADQVISLHFPNYSLVPLITPALSHLASSTQAVPNLTVFIWDSTTTGIPLPPLPWSDGIYTTSQGEFLYKEGRVLYRDDRFEIYYYSGTNLILLDETKKQAVVWMQDAADMQYHDTAAPIRTLLQWWLGRHSYQLVHAAAVGLENGGVLLAAKGGSGKSTSALVCLNSDLRYAGDDYVAITNTPEPTVHSLFSSAKIHADNIHRVPHLRDAIHNKGKLKNEKALLLLNEKFSDQIIKKFPLRALFVPRIKNQVDTVLTPASSITGLRALAPTTMFQLPGVDKAAFQTMAQLVRLLPCYWLELGSDSSQVPKIILEYLRD